MASDIRSSVHRLSGSPGCACTLRSARSLLFNAFLRVLVQSSFFQHLLFLDILLVHGLSVVRACNYITFVGAAFKHLTWKTCYFLHKLPDLSDLVFKLTSRAPNDSRSKPRPQDNARKLLYAQRISTVAERLNPVFKNPLVTCHDSQSAPSSPETLPTERRASC